MLLSILQQSWFIADHLKIMTNSDPLLTPQSFLDFDNPLLKYVMEELGQQITTWGVAHQVTDLAGRLGLVPLCGLGGKTSVWRPAIDQLGPVCMDFADS